MPHTNNTQPKNRSIGMVIAGAIALGLGLFVSPILVWSNLLIAMFFLVTLGLGGALWVALGYISGAGWNVAFRRIPEAMARIIPIAGVLLLVVLGIRAKDYGWHHHGDGGAGVFWFKECGSPQAFGCFGL